MLLLIDEGVPNSVAEYLASRDHEVRYVRELFPGGIPDPVIATIGDKLSAIVVSWDKDFEALVSRIPKGNRAKFRRLGRISFRCKETQGRRLIEQWVDYIEFHFAKVASRRDARMIVQITGNGIKLW